MVSLTIIRVSASVQVSKLHVYAIEWLILVELLSWLVSNCCMKPNRRSVNHFMTIDYVSNYVNTKLRIFTLHRCPLINDNSINFSIFIKVFKINWIIHQLHEYRKKAIFYAFMQCEICSYKFVEINRDYRYMYVIHWSNNSLRCSIILSILNAFWIFKRLSLSNKNEFVSN